MARVKGEVGAFTWLGASTSRAFPSNVSVFLDQKKYNPTYPTTSWTSVKEVVQYVDAASMYRPKSSYELC